MGLSRRSVEAGSRVAVLALVALLALVASACGGATDDSTSAAKGPPRHGGTLRVAEDTEPMGLDPTLITGSSNPVALMYSGLLRWSADMEIEPDLAESYDQPDPVTYVFRLREGVMFHNGQKFGAKDVKYTFDRILDPSLGSPAAGNFTDVESVTVVDPLTVRMKLKAPDAAFLSNLATTAGGNGSAAIIPEGATDLETKPVGTGPFKFASYSPGRGLKLVANEDYWEKDLPYLDAVEFRFFKDQGSILSALRSRAVDMAWLKDPKVAMQAGRTIKGIVAPEPVISRSLKVFFKLDKKPFDDVRVRQAISVATDRQAIVDTVLGGLGEIAGFIPSSNIGGYSGNGSDYALYQHDVDKAKALLAEAGYPNGVDLGSFKVYAPNDLDLQAAQTLQKQWELAGIRTRLEPMEIAPMEEDRLSGNFSVLSAAYTWQPDSDALARVVTSTNEFGKNAGYDDPELDRLAVAGRVEQDPDKRTEIYQELQARLVDQAYNLAIYGYPLRWEMWWGYVQGYEAQALNIRYLIRQTWLAE